MKLTVITMLILSTVLSAGESSVRVIEDNLYKVKMPTGNELVGYYDKHSNKFVVIPRAGKNPMLLTLPDGSTFEKIESIPNETPQEMLARSEALNRFADELIADAPRQNILPLKEIKEKEGKRLKEVAQKLAGNAKAIMQAINQEDVPNQNSDGIPMAISKEAASLAVLHKEYRSLEAEFKEVAERRRKAQDALALAREAMSKEVFRWIKENGDISPIDEKISSADPQAAEIMKNYAEANRMLERFRDEKKGIRNAPAPVSSYELFQPWVLTYAQVKGYKWLSNMIIQQQSDSSQR
jgi:hypothetical protein